MKKIFVFIVFLILIGAAIYIGYSINPYQGMYVELEGEMVKLKQEFEAEKAELENDIATEKYLRENPGRVLPPGAKIVKPIETELWISPTPIK